MSLFSHIDIIFLKKAWNMKVESYLFFLTDITMLYSYLGILRIVAKFLQHHDVYSFFLIISFFHF